MRPQRSWGGVEEETQVLFLLLLLLFIFRFKKLGSVPSMPCFLNACSV